MNIFERPILIFSNYCKYSNLFLENIVQYPELFDLFIRVNIDVDPETAERPAIFYEIQKILQYNITSVPTIIIENGEYVLSGKEAFSWLEFQINKLNTLNENNENPVPETNYESLEAFNPLEMGSFSDGYASIDDTIPKSQSFKFLNQSDQSINTPSEDPTPDGNYSSFMQKRNDTIDKPKYQSTSQRPHSNNTNNKDINPKSAEVNKKYEQLLAERENLMPKKTIPKKVNFSTGNCE
jgi:hypothetical protein